MTGAAAAGGVSSSGLPVFTAGPVCGDDGTCSWMDVDGASSPLARSAPAEGAEQEEKTT